jgi:diaminopimelate epimerase
MATKTPFRKMHGTGNDFVVLDGRRHGLGMDTALAERLADRHFGIGCDQLVVMEASSAANARMRIFNADGSEITTCGNATRCVGDILLTETGAAEVTIETGAGVLTAARDGEAVRVNMGAPRFDWQEIPLSESRNTLHLGLQEGLLMDPVAVNMGNPHAIFFVKDLAHIKMAEAGPKLEHHPLFPQRANISAVQVLSPAHLKMVVWERGTGLTLACGSAACAAAVAGVQRELSQRAVRIDVPGGTLHVEWTSGGDVLMSGPVAYVFEGEIAI